MRFVVIGAGAIGGVVGGRLTEHGHDVLLVARGAHHDAIAADGLLVRSPEGDVRVDVPVVDSPAAAGLGEDDVVLVAVKGQDMLGVLDGLSHAPVDTPVVCLQNGVDNERQALRRFRRVYAVPVLCPAAHLVPGVVEASSAPVTGIFDIGRYPAGVDDVAESVAAALSASRFSSVARPDVMRFKWSKLLMNLGNALEAACGPIPLDSRLHRAARAEGRAALAAADIDCATGEEDRDRRADLLSVQPVAGAIRGGGSSWQSLARGTRSIEADQLNGEIVLLGRLHGVPTPVNELLQKTANELARIGAPPASLREEELFARLAR
ncbi:MAG: 2-dehydropantoate 2-reductase N-terminal domain-containing protein [Acidimicrobiales bacterium]